MAAARKGIDQSTHYDILFLWVDDANSMYVHVFTGGDFWCGGCNFIEWIRSLVRGNMRYEIFCVFKFHTYCMMSFLQIVSDDCFRKTQGRFIYPLIPKRVCT